MKVHWNRLFHTVCPGLIYPIHGFLCFGSMFHATFKGNQWPKYDDLDIGVLDDGFEHIHVENFAKSTGFDIKHRIVDDITGKPMYFGLEPKEDAKAAYGDAMVDVFVWRKYKGIYWHTYDVKMEFPRNGIPTRYIFKGVEANRTFDEGFVNIDNIGGSMMHVQVPIKYGTLLDEWYPNWIEPRQEVSHSGYVIEMKSCAGFETGKYDTVKWREFD